jgi:hypothetical protein
MPDYSEEDLTIALAAYRNGEYTSIRKCGYAFNILASTLSDRLSTRTSRSKSYESQKILSTAEEKTVRIKTSISHRSIIGGKSGYLKEIVRIRLKISQLVSAKPARNQLRKSHDLKWRK